MKLDKSLEESIKKKAVELLEKGKPDWDIPHTLGAVRWMRELIKNEGGDEKVLVAAMYFHDTGYPVLDKGYNYQESMDAKKKHAERGAQFAREFLSKASEFSPEDIKEVCRLISLHDHHDNIYDHNRQLVFEADGLAQIDWENITPNFDKANCLAWLDKYFEKERPEGRWKTETGKKYMKELKKKAYDYWD